MDKPPPKPTFLNKHLATLVMVPGIIFVHWFWTKMQDLPAATKGFTKEQVEEGKKLPIIKLYERLEKKLFEKFSN